MSFKLVVSGQMRSGKDTIAEYLMYKHPNTILLKFADPIYELQYMIQDYLGLPKEKDRYLLQVLGTNYARNIDPNIWVNMFFKRVSELSPDTNIVCSDGRFFNEFSACKEHGFKVVNVLRPLEDRLSAGATNMTHASEQDNLKYTEFDHIFYNSSTLQHLYDQVDLYIDTITNPIIEPVCQTLSM